MPRYQSPQPSNIPPAGIDPAIFTGETWPIAPEKFPNQPSQITGPLTDFINWWKQGLERDIQRYGVPTSLGQFGAQAGTGLNMAAGDPKLTEYLMGQLAHKYSMLGTPQARNNRRIMKDIQRQIDEMGGKIPTYEWDSKRKKLAPPIDKLMNGASNYSMIWSILGPLAKQYQIQRLKETGGA